MPTYFDAATIERARVLVETTVRTLEDIAVELGTSVQTLRNWIKRYGWRRHPQAPRARPKLPPEKEGPARRIYESGAGSATLPSSSTATRAMSTASPSRGAGCAGRRPSRRGRRSRQSRRARP
jgi:hypothetical protein